MTKRALGERDWEIDELVLGLNVPQRQSFYGAPTLAARLGLGAITGPLLMQACATIGRPACTARAAGGGRRAARRRDRPHEQRPASRLPSAGAPGGTPISENWVLDSFGCDPNTRRRDARPPPSEWRNRGGFSKAEIDAVTARRWSQPDGRD